MSERKPTLVIVRKCVRPKSGQEGSAVVRIAMSHYNKVLDIAAKSGRSIAHVVGKALCFALENVEIVDEFGCEEE